MLVSDILQTVREALNDPAKDRYSDAYLMRLMNEGLLDLSKRLRLFKSEASIPFVKGQAVYSLPLDFIEFDDISINGETDIGFISRQQVQTKAGSNWRQAEIDGAPTNVMYNKQTFYQFRVYPVPTGDSIYDLYDIDLFGFASDIEDIESPDQFGIFASLDDVINSILFDPAKVASDLDNISNQVNFLASQVSQYSQAITANTVAIQQVYGIAASAQSAAQGAQVAASAAVTTTNQLTISLDALGNTVDTLATNVSTISSGLTTTAALATTANNTANAAQTASSAATVTANSAVTTANSAQSRLNNVDGANKTIETLATNVTTLTAGVTSAQTTANTANTNAGTAQNTANSALTIANSATARLNNTGGGNSIESLASQVTTLTASVATANTNASAAITTANNVNTRVNNIGSEPAITAIATSVTSLTSTVGTNTSNVSTLQSAVAALQSTTASWQVSTTVNGLTNGFGIYNDGTVEKVIFRTDKFEVYPVTGNTGQFAFGVEGGVVKILNASIGNVIQSDNFVTGVSGWKIDKATGIAEFASVTARGAITATAVNAATGTFSGSLTAAAVNAVNTINLVDQSVVIAVTYYDVNTITLDTVGKTIATKSITMSQATSASTIVLHASFSVGIVSNGDAGGGGIGDIVLGKAMVIRIVRDGTTIATFTKPIYQVVAGGSSTSVMGEVFVDFVDQPGAGTFNYQVQWTAGIGSGVAGWYTASNKYMSLSAGKK